MFTALQNYADFSGRARRQEFWMFSLLQLLAIILASVLDAVLGFPILSLIVGLGLFIPALSVSVRRLHDTDRSGFWLLLIFIPVIGAIVLFVFYLLEGTRGPNRFGPDPKGL